MRAPRPAVRLGDRFQHRDPVAPGEGMWPRSGALAEKGVGDEPPRTPLLSPRAEPARAPLPAASAAGGLEQVGIVPNPGVRRHPSQPVPLL